MNKERKTKVLAFCLQPIPSAMLGVMKILNYLQEQGKLEVQFKKSIDVRVEDICWADVVVPIRSCEPIERSIIEQAKIAGRFVVYFLDDDLLNIPSDSLSAVYFNQSVIRESMLEIIAQSDAFWTTNINLKTKYAQGKRAVLSNVPVGAEEVEAKERLSEKDDIIRVGFAGSVDHGPFIEKTLKSIVEELGETHPKIQFEFFGCKPKFMEKDKKNAIHIPYTNDYESYRQTMIERSWDIGLAPLKDSDFHKCKYFNKYVEYTTLGICGIYSNLQPFVFAVENEKNGILVENSIASWKAAIIKLAEDKKQRKQILETSQKHLKQQFSYESVAKNLVENVPELIAYEAEEFESSGLALAEVPKNTILYKLVNHFRIYGLKAPFIILKKVIHKLCHR